MASAKHLRRSKRATEAEVKVADFAIGDIQGCYDPLMRLLEKINFNDRVDRLWFVGDLVNRGKQSLAVLRFISSLTLKPRITLGNHDLHLLAKLFANQQWQNHDDTLAEILAAPDAEELGHWLRKQSILYYDTRLNVAMCHAGIAPCWDLKEAENFAHELEQTLAGENYRDYLSYMYGNEPACWSLSLTGMARLRLITNYFTRMRFCDAQGCLIFGYKDSLANAPSHYYPWYAVPGRKTINAHLVFGHWASLQGKSPAPTIHAIDTGCLWGGRLTALRLQDKQRFAVAGI